MSNIGNAEGNPTTASRVGDIDLTELNFTEDCSAVTPIKFIELSVGILMAHHQERRCRDF